MVEEAMVEEAMVEESMVVEASVDLQEDTEGLGVSVAPA
jgi:hypothetical protein